MAILKVRKKPVEVEAVQVLWENWPLLCEFIPAEQFGGGFFVNNDNQTMGLRIHTLEGTMTVTEGGWIVRGVKGEVYPVRQDIFEETYEIIGVSSYGSIGVSADGD